MLIVEIMVVMVGALRVVGVVVIVMIVTMEAGVIMEETMMRPDAEKWLGIGGADDKEYFGLKDLNVFTPHDANSSPPSTRCVWPTRCQEHTIGNSTWLYINKQTSHGIIAKWKHVE